MSDLQEEAIDNAPHFASIDLGSNTILLLIARLDSNGALKEVRQEQRFPRLGKGLQHSGKLLPQHIEKAFTYLDQYVNIAKAYQVEWISAVGTAALREAQNSGEFMASVQKRLGVEIHCISGVEEARYSYIGALSNKKDLSGRVMVVDIGGGSTEFIWGRNGKFEGEISLPVGSVKLTEKFGFERRTDLKRIEEGSDFFSHFLQEWENNLPSDINHIIGTAGTFTTLAAIHLQLDHYDGQLVDRSKLSLKQIEEILDRLRYLEAEERLEIPGIVPGREDVILGGAVIARHVLQHWQIDQVMISDRGLRFGAILERLKRDHSANPH